MLLSVWIGTTCLVAVVTGLVVYWLIQKWKYKYPPGPTALPLIGNLLQVKFRKMHEQAFEWSKKYGPVITIRLGPVPFVFVNTIDTALEVLVKKSTDFASRKMIPSADLFTNGGKDIAFSDYGPTWKLHRTIASKALRNYLLGDTLEQRLFEAVNAAFVEIDKVSGQFDPGQYINFIVTNILTSMCFGEKYDFNDKEFSQLLKMEDELIKNITEGVPEDFIPGLRYVYKSKAFKQLEGLKECIIEGFIRRKYKERESTFNKDDIRHFTDTLIFARMEAKKGEGMQALSALDEDHLIQTLAEIYFAGIDALRLTLEFALLHMVAFSDIQSKVQDEIANAVGKERLPGLADRPYLGYTEAVIRESMRLATIGPTGIFHESSCDSEICGYRIPKGTSVVINHWALHNDPSAWDDVDRFIPERYLDEDGKLGPKPKSWLPFSAGTRVCLGEFVAKPILHLIFASLMQRYKWKLESGICPDINPVGTPFTLSCKPYKVIAEKRI